MSLAGKFFFNTKDVSYFEVNFTVKFSFIFYLIAKYKLFCCHSAVDYKFVLQAEFNSYD